MVFDEVQRKAGMPSFLQTAEIERENYLSHKKEGQQSNLTLHCIAPPPANKSADSTFLNGVFSGLLPVWSPGILPHSISLSCTNALSPGRPDVNPLTGVQKSHYPKPQGRERQLLNSLTSFMN
jgi:hypothetical protein